MSKVIRISDEVFRHLQEEAKARKLGFISPDNLLRVLFGLKQTGRKQGKS